MTPIEQQEIILDYINGKPIKQIAIEKHYSVEYIRMVATGKYEKFKARKRQLYGERNVNKRWRIVK